MTSKCTWDSRICEKLRNVRKHHHDQILHAAQFLRGDISVNGFVFTRMTRIPYQNWHQSSEGATITLKLDEIR